MLRAIKGGAAVVVTVLALSGCQSPTDPDDTIVVDDFVEGSQNPDPANATSGDGRVYEKPQTDLPSLFLPYDWKVRFDVILRINGTADDEDLDLVFPIEITSVNVTVNQCSGGIVIPPTGDAIYTANDVVSSTGNSFPGVNTSQTLTLDVWYDLPNGRKEACIDVTAGLKWDNEDGVEISASKVVKIRVGG
jgi:hypothetical protein